MQDPVATSVACEASSGAGCSARPEGWKPLINSHKWHYFRDGRSLCRKWMTLGDGELDPRTIKSPDNCAACYRIREKEIADRPNHSRQPRRECGVELHGVVGSLDSRKE